MSKHDDDSNTSENVGYKRPPSATRFRKGVSGNPKGRPRGSLNLASAFLRALRARVVVNENGQRKTITKLEAAVKQLVNKAAAGDLRALQLLTDLARDAEAKQNSTPMESSSLGEIDHEVMQGILERFSSNDETVSETAEGLNDDSKSR